LSATLRKAVVMTSIDTTTEAQTPEAPELTAIAQECTQALVVVGQGGSGYVLNDTITLPAGVIVKATTMTAGAVASVTIINRGSTTAPPANPVSQVSTSGAGTGAKFNLQWAPILDVFPGFTPIYPPPPVGQGSGSTPPFPPPSIPPPAGPLVGPVFGSGGTSHTSPTGTVVITWPGFSTTFPNPPLTVSNVWTVPTLASGVWTTHLPAQIVTTPCVLVGGWGLPGPSGSGPGPPTYPSPPGAGRPSMMMSEEPANENGNDNGNGTTRQRRRRSA
jgi:hypothetical protein